MATAPAFDLTRDRVLGVETPENVRIDYPLAGLGSRFSALLIDGFLMSVLLLAVPLVMSFFSIHEILPPGFALALLFLWIFAVMWGYFLVFEAFRDGQTPGKRWLSIRVVMEDGTPVTFQAAAIRNLLRILDVQPLTSCLVGGLFMLLGGKSRRLGDLAAGTVVVREQPIEFPDLGDLSAAPTSFGAPRLDDARFQVLETFADQHAALDPEARQRVARRLATSFSGIVASDGVSDLLALYADETARRRAARLHLSAGSPAAIALLRTKRSRWETFRQQVAQLRGRGLKKAPELFVAEFAARYRELTADLARARTYGASSGTIWSLERLAGAAHNLLYRPVERPFSKAARFLAGGFPRLVRRLWLPIGVAALMLYGTGLVAFVAARDPEIERRLADHEMIAHAVRAQTPGTDYRDTWNHIWRGSSALSSQLISNNVQVSFMAFAGGVTGGLFSAFILLFNGLLLGTVLAVFANRGVLDNIGTFVLPHGFIELTAIAIAGGAGLWMGSAFFWPGRRRRLDAFALRAKESVALIGGVTAMLIVAGLIEGFVSPARLPAYFKVLAGVLFASMTLQYLLVVGRERRVATPQDATAPPAA